MACANKSNTDSENSNNNNHESEEETISWLDDHVSLSSHYDGVAVRDNVIYGHYLDGDGTQVVAQDLQSGEILQSVKIDDVTEVQCIAADAEGNIYLVEVESLNYGGILWKIDTQGNASVVNDIVLEDLSFDGYFLLDDIYIDANGYFYFYCEVDVRAKYYDSEIIALYENAGFDINEFDPDSDATVLDRIYVKDSEMNTIFYDQVPRAGGTKMLAFSLDENETPIVLAKDTDGAYIQELDLENQALGSQQRLDSMDFSEIDGQMAFTEDGFIFCQGNDLYRYYYDTKQQEHLLNLSSYGVLGQNILSLSYKDGRIQVVDNYKATENSEYVTFEEGVDTKETITLGVMMTTDEIEQIVAGFNRFNDTARVQIVTYYSDGEDYDTDLEQLKLDLVSGEAPDIIEVSEISPSLFAEKGAFADLYDFMEKDDDFSKDMLMSSPIAAFEMDGHLYSIGYAFQLYSIWGSDSLIQGQSGVSTDEFVEILASSGKDVNAVYGFSADEPVLTTLCAFAMDDFIDWENASCSLSGDYMGTILDFAKNYKNGYTGNNVRQGITDGDIQMTVGFISSVADYQVQNELYQGKVSFIGYPTVGGSGTAVGFRSGEFAINSDSSKQEAAWEFVKFCLENGYDGNGFPMLKEQFEETMEEAMEPDEQSSVEGTYELPKESYYVGDGDYVNVYAASQSDVDAVIRLIDSIDTRHQYNTKIQQIIDEEAESYLNGETDLQSTVELIQNRVTVYLQEQM